MVALGNWANRSCFSEGVASGRPEGNGNGFSVVIELASGIGSNRQEVESRKLQRGAVSRFRNQESGSYAN
jgi:hypothetical protein